jgi:hypothetical protein
MVELFIKYFVCLLLIDIATYAWQLAFEGLFIKKIG